jgi:NAD(P)-dependent dehydrogenase (short-subunit alcohol dehydrogenase family)
LTSSIKHPDTFVSIITEMVTTVALAGKRALVTGASRGMGVAIAKALAAEGADVAITYEKSASARGDVPAVHGDRSVWQGERHRNGVAFLASPNAQYITGSTLTVDGGANA